MAATPPLSLEDFSQQYVHMNNVAYHPSGVTQMQHPPQPRANATLLHPPYVHPQPSTSAAATPSSSQANARPSTSGGHPPQPTIFITTPNPVYRSRFDALHPAFLSLPEPERRGFDLFRRHLPALPRHIIGRFPDETILDRVLWSAMLPEESRQRWIRNGAMGIDPASVPRSEASLDRIVQALTHFLQHVQPLSQGFNVDEASRQWREFVRRQRAQAQQAAAMSQARPSNHRFATMGMPMMAQAQQRVQAGMQMMQPQQATIPQQHPALARVPSDPRLLNVPSQGMQAHPHHQGIYAGMPMYYPPAGMAQMNGAMPPPPPPSRAQSHTQSRPSSGAAHAQQRGGNKRKRAPESNSPSPQEDPADSPPARKKARKGAMAPSPVPQLENPLQPTPRTTPVPFPIFYDPSQGIPMGAMPYPQMLPQPLNTAQRQYLAQHQYRMAQQELPLVQDTLTPEQQMARNQQILQRQHAMLEHRHQEHLQYMAAQQNGASLDLYAHIPVAQDHTQVPGPGHSIPSNEIPNTVSRDSTPDAVIPGVPIAHEAASAATAPEQLLRVPTPQHHPQVQSISRPASSNGALLQSVRSLPYYQANSAQGSRVSTPAQPQAGPSRLAFEPPKPKPKKQPRTKGAAVSRDGTPAKQSNGKGKGKGKARAIEIVAEEEEAQASPVESPSTNETISVVAPSLPPTPPPEPLGEHDHAIPTSEMLAWWHEYTRRQRAACDACQSEGKCEVSEHREANLDVHDWMVYDDENFDEFAFVPGAIPADGFRINLPCTDGRRDIDHMYLFDVLSPDELDTLALSFFFNYLTSPLLSMRVSNDDDAPNPNADTTDISSGTNRS